MAIAPKPDMRPANANFSSGPCAKRPGFTLDALSGAMLGRSHRASAPKARLAEVIERSRAILGMPADWRLGIVPASDTGAVEMALWSLLGAARRRCAGVRELRRGLGHRCGEAASPAGCARAVGAVRPAAGPRRGRFRPRRGVSVERHDLRRARAERRLDRARPPGPDDLRCHVRGVRDARCRGTGSMSSPGPGRRCWAARRRTACWRCRRARWSGW